MSRIYRDEDSRWHGMSDGDTTSVETPFGEAVFQYDAGDESVGIGSGILVVELIVGRLGFSFDREALERATTKVGSVELTLADALDQWAEGV
jgi:hypothetical protein